MAAIAPPSEFPGGEGDTRIRAEGLLCSQTLSAMSAPRFIANKTGGVEKERMTSPRSFTQSLKLRL